MLPRFSEPNARAKTYTMDEAAHDKFVKELLALGDKAVALATKKGNAGDVLTKYRALSGAARTAFYAKHSLALFAALNAAR